jgi:hypothetical protein
MRYTRTSAGTDAVLNPKIAIPRPLKSLLLAINGQFDPYAYASRLQGAGDLPAMLEELIKAGYVRALAGTYSQTVGFAGTKSVPQRAWPDAASPRILQDAVADITDFVMSHLPDDALEISLALEGLSTTAELKASLGAYEAKIRHLGEIAVHHLAKVKLTLGGV